jgi:putative redox protein
MDRDEILGHGLLLGIEGFADSTRDPPTIRHSIREVRRVTAFDVETVSLDGGATALGWSGGTTLVVDRPATAGGRGLGFNGGQLLNLAVAGCVSNDLFREAAKQGLVLTRVAVRVRSDYVGDPAVSTPIEVDVDVAGEADEATLRELVAHVDAIAEIPNSLRRGTEVRLGTVTVG